MIDDKEWKKGRLTEREERGNERMEEGMNKLTVRCRYTCMLSMLSYFLAITYRPNREQTKDWSV